MLRSICADPATREKIVAQMIERGGEYERAAARWDIDIDCEQVDLPVDPVYDAADSSDAASHSDWIYDARWSPDGKLIVTASKDKTVRVWDFATGRTVKLIDLTALPASKPATRPGTVRAARFLDSGPSIVVAADGHPIRIFDVASGEQVAEVPYTRVPGAPNNYPQFAISDDAGLLAIALPGQGGHVRVQVLELDTGRPVWSFDAKTATDRYNTPGSIALSRDGQLLAIDVIGLVLVYDVENRKPVSRTPAHPYFEGRNLNFTADGKAIIGGVTHAMLTDLASGKRIHQFGPFNDNFHAADVSPDGKYLVTGHLGSNVRIWEIETGTFYRRLGKNVSPPG